MFAEIIIPLSLPKNYTWAIPESLLESVKPGVRVEVNLGKNKKYAGIVKKILSEKPAFIEAKDIIHVLDNEPVVLEPQLKLWEWMAQYYMCSEGEVMAAALPAHFKLSSETILVFNEEYGDNFSGLDHDEYIVAEALLIKKELRLNEIQQLLDSADTYPVTSRLIRKKVCFVWEALKQGYTAKTETFVVLDPVYQDEDKLAELLNGWTRAPKQMELLLAYLHFAKMSGEVSKAELLKKAGASDAQLKGLVEKGILIAEKRNVDRIPQLPRNINIDFTLSDAQVTALDEVRKKLEQKPVGLLHGVTSGGKTNIYIRLIEEYLKKGQQVLYMLPEIALTSQIIRRLQKHFGGHIGVYHSRFSQNERVETWHKVRTEEYKVILGARSSVFLPFQNLGLVICDEEHDSSFKQQEPAPRYHGRDAAIYLASICQAKVLLGSATPSLESYYNAHTGKYGFTELTQRFGEGELPIVEIIDIRKQINKDKTKLIFSQPLVEGIEAVLEKGKQVIIFQNRRGYSPYQLCKTCGWIPQCKYCDVSLTFHKLNNKLVCHYCGTQYPTVHTCAACGNHDFIQRNFGTEKIEEQLQELFPAAKVARMDVDAVRGKNAHDTLIRLFEQQKVDILVGTQMVVKGLDFDHVDLVGIPDADGLLHFADFRVNERAFQLIEQVSGRTGRKDASGRVVVQTSQPTHPVLQQVQIHDYRAMYEAELDKRKQFSYPPFSKLIHLTFRHKFKELVDKAAKYFAKELQPKYGTWMVGPAEPVVGRVRNQYIMELLLKLPRDSRIMARCKKDILEQVAIMHQQPSFKSVTVIADVDAL